MKRFKQIMAVTAIVIILGLYLTTLVLAILGNSVSHSLFMASLYATVIVPAMLYIFVDGEITAQRRYNEITNFLMDLLLTNQLDDV